MTIYCWPPGRRAKLSIEQVDDAILNCLEPWQDAVFAAKFHDVVTPDAIRLLRTGRTWGWRRRELAAEGIL